MSAFKNLIGMKFGKLTVLERAENSTHHTRWSCICECGNKTTSHTTSLTSGRSKSCGCLSMEKIKLKNTTHGDSNSKLFSIWCGMKKRCYNKKYEHYNVYGGKGIKVCDEWVNDYICFKTWSLKNGYIEGLEIDRIENDKDYCPENCRWETRKNQMRNRTNTLFLEINGEKKSFAEWCEIYNIKYKLAHARFKKGYSIENVFNITHNDKRVDNA